MPIDAPPTDECGYNDDAKNGDYDAVSYKLKFEHERSERECELKLRECGRNYEQRKCESLLRCSPCSLHARVSYPGAALEVPFRSSLGVAREPGTAQ